MSDTRELNRMVLSPDWRLASAADADPATVAQAIAEIEQAKSLAEIEPKLNGPHAEAVLDALRPIGAKIDPRMDANQGTAWRAAVTMALSDLPPRIALYAVRKTVHVPMSFLNEVEREARKIATEALERQTTALYRLKRMRAEIERALAPQPMIEAPPPMVWTEESVAEANAAFKLVGADTRYRLVGTEVETFSAKDIAAEEN